MMHFASPPHPNPEHSRGVKNSAQMGIIPIFLGFVAGWPSADNDNVFWEGGFFSKLR